jgi:hypothetical protein
VSGRLSLGGGAGSTLHLVCNSSRHTEPLGRRKTRLDAALEPNPSAGGFHPEVEQSRQPCRQSPEHR